MTSHQGREPTEKDVARREEERKFNELPRNLQLEIVAQQRKLQGPVYTPIPDDMLPKIAQALHARNLAKERMDEATNPKELEELVPQFILAHKAMLRAFNVRPCDADDCTKFIVGRANKRYCSDRCRKKANNQRWNMENRDKKEMSNIKHWESVKKDIEQNK